MTTLKALTLPACRVEEASLPPVRWRRMTWVTWQQHRSALIGVPTVLGAIALWVWIAGIQLRHAYLVATACHPSDSITCSDLINAFNGMNGFLANGLILQAVPALIGAFVGAPMLAREMESGTFRFAWTQGFGRCRSTLAKLVALGVVVAAAAGALSILVSWYYQPYFSAGSRALSLSKDGTIGAAPFAPGLFDLREVAFAAWTLAAFAIGAVAGVVIRRVVPWIATTLATYAGLSFAAGGLLRPHYLTPLVTSGPNLPGTAWIFSQWSTKGAQPISQSAIDQLLEGAPASVAGRGGIPRSVITMQYLARHGYAQLTSYQPASRFWPFQWIESSWLLALSVLAIAATVWLVQRRAVCTQ